MWGRLKFTYEVLNRTARNQIAWNQTMQSLTKACIAKSCEICALLRYYRGADKSLAQPGRKQANISVRMA